MALDLHQLHESGNGDPLIILHGLFGSSRNWASMAKRLTDCGDVFALDLRNHGQSPHADSHTLEDLSDDVARWVKTNDTDRKIQLIGHSMGGLAAMSFALRFPEKTKALIVVDIAPRPYPPHHQREFAALNLDISQFDSRQAIDQAMASVIEDSFVRQFLMMNLKHENGRYAWQINTKVLERAAFTHGLEELTDARYEGPTLFVCGGESGYVSGKDHEIIRSYFPGATIETIEGADHWLHYSSADDFYEIVSAFLSSIASS